MHQQASNERRLISCEPKGNDSPKRVAENMGRAQTEMVDELGEVGHIFRHVPLAGRSFAFTVASSVVGDDTEAPTECRNDAVPVVVVNPRAVDEHEGITTLTGELQESLTPLINALGMRILSSGKR